MYPTNKYLNSIVFDFLFFFLSEIYTKPLNLQSGIRRYFNIDQPDRYHFNVKLKQFPVSV